MPRGPAGERFSLLSLLVPLVRFLHLVLPLFSSLVRSAVILCRIPLAHGGRLITRKPNVSPTCSNDLTRYSQSGFISLRYNRAETATWHCSLAFYVYRRFTQQSAPGQKEFQVCQTYRMNESSIKLLIIQVYVSIANLPLLSFSFLLSEM